MDAIFCWMTNSGDPTLSIVVPTLIYGSILTGMFITTSSPLMPVVVSIILAGIIFAAFPATGLTIALITIMLVLSAGGLVLTWRLGL